MRTGQRDQDSKLWFILERSVAVGQHRTRKVEFDGRWLFQVKVYAHEMRQWLCADSRPRHWLAACRRGRPNNR